MLARSARIDFCQVTPDKYKPDPRTARQVPLDGPVDLPYLAQLRDNIMWNPKVVTDFRVR